MENESIDPKSKPRTETSFLRRAGLVTAIVLITLLVVILLWRSINLVLLFFAGILLAIFLRAASGWMMRRFKLPPTIAITTTVLLILGSFALLGWFIAPSVTEQFHELTEQLPKALDRFRQFLADYSWGQRILEWLPQQSEGPSATNVVTQVKGFFSVTLNAVTDILVILFVAFYLAVEPQTYQNGFLKLLPITRRPRGAEILSEMGINLRQWLFGQLASMVIVGVLIGLGMWAIGVPLALTIGILAGLLDFIPVVGPLLSGIPAVLLAFSKSPTHAFYALLVFVGMQFLEGHVFIPLIQKRVSQLPPVLTVLSMILFSTLFGFLGLLLATPLLVVVMVAIKKIYIEDILQDKEAAAQMPLDESSEKNSNPSSKAD